MPKFKKKPVVIDAILCRDAIEAFRTESKAGVPAWLMAVYEKGGVVLTEIGILLPTLEGQMVASPDDWIICGVKGEVYPCKPDIFEATYESVD